MTKTEFRNRIKLAWETPNCIIEFERKAGYVWKEEGMTFATPGVAVMCVGLDNISENRAMRAFDLRVEWSYLMHMEQAINLLFTGNTYGYNDCVERAGESALKVKPMFFRWKDIDDILNVLK